MGILRFACGAALAAAALAAQVAAATAHSDLRRVVPENGSVLTASPTFVRLRFDDPIRITSLRILNEYDEEAPILRESGSEPTEEYVAEPGLLSPGVYRVEWRGLAPDGHSMSGAFGFEIAE